MPPHLGAVVLSRLHGAREQRLLRPFAFGGGFQGPHGQRFASRLESEYDEVAMHDGYQCRHSSQSRPRGRQLW